MIRLPLPGLARANELPKKARRVLRIGDEKRKRIKKTKNKR